MSRWYEWRRLLPLLLLIGICALPGRLASQSTPPGLGDTSWQLVKFQGSDDKTLIPDDRSKYTLEFGADGSLVARIDCNRGRATWKSAGPGQLELGLLALTRALCAPESLHDQIVKQWPFVRSYVIKDGDLFLSLMADGGIYEFEPLPAAKPVASTGGRSPVDANRIVKVDAGTLEGSLSGGVLSFKGVPYAAPPFGDLRWRAPQPVAPWTGIRKATEYGHDCMQVAADYATAQLRTTPSEDCLVLNVWRPAERRANERLPVMVWIHGGGYVNGGSSAAITDGSRLATHGLVIVSFNYRLGRLGFFAHPALLAAKDGPVGNYGYMDQIAALKWVQRNIAAFSGDPARVTLAGESAGGASVLHLVTSPVTKGLFQQVVIMSGGGRKALAARAIRGGTAEQPSADQSDAAFAESLGIEGAGPETLAKLRALPAQRLVGDLSVRAALAPAILTGIRNLEGTPMVDGAIVVDDPGAIFSQGKVRIPIIVGTTALDLPLFFPPRADPYSYFGANAGKAKAAYDPSGTADLPITLPGLPGLPIAIAPSMAVLAIGADMTMHEPARFVARSVTAAGSSAWLYRFTYVIEAQPSRQTGAPHSQDVSYLFDTLEAFYGAGRLTDKDRRTAREFSTYVATFAKTGDPNGTGLPRWPKFDASQFDLMNFTLDEGPVFGPDPRAARIELVEAVVDATQHTKQKQTR